MSISMKILEKAVGKKDFNFIVKRLVEYLQENGWSYEEIVILAQRLKAYCE